MKALQFSYLHPLLFVFSIAISTSEAQVATTTGTFSHQIEEIEYTAVWMSHRFENRNISTNVIVLETDDFDSAKPAVRDFRQDQAILDLNGKAFTIRPNTVYFFNDTNHKLEKVDMKCPKTSAIDYKTFFEDFTKARKIAKLNQTVLDVAIRTPLTSK